MNETAPDTISVLVPENVIDAIRCVMRELPAIGKLSKDQHDRASGRASSDDGKGISYSYRSIEQITGAARQLCAKYGVVFVPEVIPPPDARLAEREFTMGKFDTRWTDTYMTVMFKVYGPGGVDDCITAGPVMSLGRDNSDKGYNKAMTQAFKQVLLQVFQIADSSDEGEHERHLQEGVSTRSGSNLGVTRTQGPWWEVLGFEDEDQAKATNDSLRPFVDQLDDRGKGIIRPWLQEHRYSKSLPISLADAPEYAELLKQAIADQGDSVMAALTGEPAETAQDGPGGDAPDDEDSGEPATAETGLEALTNCPPEVIEAQAARVKAMRIRDP